MVTLRRVLRSKNKTGLSMKSPTLPRWPSRAYVDQVENEPARFDQRAFLFEPSCAARIVNFQTRQQNRNEPNATKRPDQAPRNRL